ncbi:MAG: hypothetical protein AAF569_07645 [Pseudomonadota bacterium]
MLNQSETPKQTSSRRRPGSILSPINSIDFDFRRNDDDGESGNIFIYIIGAIFLIGILTALVRGSSTPGSGIDREELILKASQVRAYAAELERGVSFVLRNAHSETEISFAHPNHSSAYGTYGTTPTAEVFHPSGGGVEWRDNDTDIQTQDEDWIFNARNRVEEVGQNSGGGPDTTELIAFLPYVTQDFCIAVNESVGVTNPSDIPPQDIVEVQITSHFFTGSYAGGFLISSPGDELDGKLEGCLEGDTTPPSGTYHYYKVLLAR